MELKIQLNFVRFILLVYHKLENTSVERGFWKGTLALGDRGHHSNRTLKQGVDVLNLKSTDDPAPEI